MRLDVRTPIGLMFSITGALLVVYGLISDPAIYERSLGININLWWGLAQLLFGGVMVGLAVLAARREAKEGPASPPAEGERARVAMH